MRNADGYIMDLDAYFADRGEQLRSIDQALGFLSETATDEQRERIVDYIQATRHVAFHAIAAVLGTRCRCVQCFHREGCPNATPPVPPS